MQTALRYVAFIVAGGILVISLFADQLGIGGAPGFGSKQIAGALFGVVALAALAWLSTRKR